MIFHIFLNSWKGGRRMKKYEKPVVITNDNYKASNSSNCPQFGEPTCGSEWQKR